MKSLSDIIKTLKKENLSSQELNQAIEDLEMINDCSIAWAVEDFETRADEEEKFRIESDPNTELPLFDRSKFEGALKEMIHEHDAGIGITWDTISYYLNECCRIDERLI